MTLPFRTSSLVVVLCLGAACSRPTEKPVDSATAAAASAIPYGANAPASGTFTHDGVKLYYETYGDGRPLLLVHGNGLSIGAMAAQIEFFRKRYKVIAMDSRDHGRSADSDSPITYEKMTDDLAARRGPNHRHPVQRHRQRALQPVGGAVRDRVVRLAGRADWRCGDLRPGRAAGRRRRGLAWRL